MQKNTDETPDAVLAAQTRLGNSNAFGELYDRYFDRLYRYIFFRVSNRQEAEDLTETVFLKTLEAIQHRKSTIRNFKAWLFRSAHNIVIDHYRANKQEVPLETVLNLIEQPSGNGKFMNEITEGNLLSNAINQLEPNLQELITCRFIAGLSHAETAEIMGLKVGHLRVLQFRALKQLKYHISKDLEHHE